MGQELSHIKQTKPDHVILSQAMEKIAEVDPGNKVGITKSKSSYAHFSDYCMYPDRFNEKCIPALKVNNAPKPIEIAAPGSQQGTTDCISHFADYSVFPDKLNMKRSMTVNNPGDLNLEHNAAAKSLPTGFLSKYRTRSCSATDSDIKAHADQIDKDNLSPTADVPRARSLSNSKMYYFDFSMIPDKDPNKVYDERRRFDHLLQIPEERGGGGSSMPSSLPPKNSMEDVAQKAKRVRKTSEQFGFFDYSMIPDKDPKFFNNKKK